MSTDRIAAVLRIRRLQERRERSEVAARRSQHRSACLAEQTAWDAVGRRADGEGSGPVPAALVLAHRQIVEGGISVATQRGETTRIASHAVAVQVGAWTVAARRVEGLERLEERLRSAERAETERRAAIEIDDLVLSRRRGDQRHGVSP